MRTTHPRLAATRLDVAALGVPLTVSSTGSYGTRVITRTTPLTMALPWRSGASEIRGRDETHDQRTGRPGAYEGRTGQCDGKLRGADIEGLILVLPTQIQEAGQRTSRTRCTGPGGVFSATDSPEIMTAFRTAMSKRLNLGWGILAAGSLRRKLRIPDAGFA